MQYAPTQTDENRAGFRFVFIRGIKNWIGINFDRPLAWPSVGRMLLRPYPDRRKPGRVSVRFYPMKTKMAGDSMIRHPRKGVWGCPILVVRFLDHMPGLHFEVAVDDIDG